MLGVKSSALFSSTSLVWENRGKPGGGPRFNGENQQRRIHSGFSGQTPRVRSILKADKLISDFATTTADTSRSYTQSLDSNCRPEPGEISSVMSEPQNLSNLLDLAAKDPSSNGITIYRPYGSEIVGNANSTYSHCGDTTLMTYYELQNHALEESIAVQGLLELHANQIVLLHVDNHLDSIHWFWAILAAGGVPCMSSPFSQDAKQRCKHIEMLQKLLGNPIIITSDHLLTDFDGVDNLRLWNFGKINQWREQLHKYVVPALPCPATTARKEDMAVLMLTSGSTGNAKAVCLTHGQILASVAGKSQLHNTSNADVFLNWTGLDHVANLLEIHLHAMSLCAHQVHVAAAEVLAKPLSFLDKISQHRVSCTFAPNFFLGTLVSKLSTSDQQLNSVDARLVPTTSDDLPMAASLHSIRNEPNSNDANMRSTNPYPTPPNDRFELSCLRAFISGGEANVVQTCADLTSILQQFGAPSSFIRPGFGMTETCAGSIYNAIDCPEYDMSQSSEFACVGLPIPGMEMRIIRKDGSIAHQGEIGELQVSGTVIFPCYYNNVEETEKVRTADGWFRTGDKGTIDTNGRLCLTGREKDLVIVNGSNLHPQGIESAIEEANIPGVTPSYTVVFGHRPADSHTEVIVVIYLPTYSPTDPVARGDTAIAISKATIRYCSVRPYKIIPLDLFLLQKSTLGKLSRPKIRNNYEDGQYDELIRIDEQIIENYHELLFLPPKTETEKALVDLCNEMFRGSVAQVGINNNLLTLGASSIDLLTLKMRLQKRLSISAIPITLFFSHLLIRDLAFAISEILPTSSLSTSVETYDPVVVLNPNPGTTKTPIWFIHPGMGEILIFLNLCRYIIDRPVYALRARGFDDSNFYTSMTEIITSYLSGIKRVQPKGPYALCGYSFGSILTFEITKILESQGEEVKFLGTLDQPPFFKTKARTYDWYECAMTVAFFLGMMGEGYAYGNLPAMRKLTQAQVLDHIFELAPPGRLEELCMTREKLNNWANLAYQLKVIAWDYDPEGVVERMDVFYTGPLLGLVKAKTMEEWRTDYIGKWDSFVSIGEVKYHEIKGTHRTIITPPYLVGFWKVFKRAMDERGL